MGGGAVGVPIRPELDSVPLKGGRVLAPQVTCWLGVSWGQLGGPTEGQQTETDTQLTANRQCPHGVPPIVRVVNPFLALVCPSLWVVGPVLGRKPVDLNQVWVSVRPPTDPQLAPNRGQPTINQLVLGSSLLMGD